MIEVEWLAGCPQMGKSLKLRCSIPQCDSFFKRSFLTCTKNLKKMKNGEAKNVARRFDNGASCLTRTGDTLINSQVL